LPRNLGIGELEESGRLNFSVSRGETKREASGVGEKKLQQLL